MCGQAGETAGDDTLEIWLWQENREIGQQLQREEGIRERLGLGFGVFCSCVLLYFFKWEMLEHVCMLGLALFSYLCVYIVYVLYSTLVVMCDFWGCLPTSGPLGDKTVSSISFLSCNHLA